MRSSLVYEKETAAGARIKWFGRKYTCRAKKKVASVMSNFRFRLSSASISWWWVTWIIYFEFKASFVRTFQVSLWTCLCKPAYRGDNGRSFFIFLFLDNSASAAENSSLRIAYHYCLIESIIVLLPSAISPPPAIVGWARFNQAMYVSVSRPCSDTTIKVSHSNCTFRGCRRYGVIQLTLRSADYKKMKTKTVELVRIRTVKFNGPICMM